MHRSASRPIARALSLALLVIGGSALLEPAMARNAKAPGQPGNKPGFPGKAEGRPPTFANNDNKPSKHLAGMNSGRTDVGHQSAQGNAAMAMGGAMNTAQVKAAWGRAMP